MLNRLAHPFPFIVRCWVKCAVICLLMHLGISLLMAEPSGELNDVLVSSHRGGIEFSLANAAVVSVGSEAFVNLDVMVSSPEPEQRLGTGIVLLNYNTECFGPSVKTNDNVIVSSGDLITTSPFPLYMLLLNDNSASRLAITYEYLFTAGSGSLLSSSPQQLLNIKFRIAQTGYYSGFSFQAGMMLFEQYLDDNATLFNPVLASGTENSLIPGQPGNISLTRNGDSLNMTWMQQIGCSYNVYSADVPDAQIWQIEAAGLIEPAWSCSFQASRRFYRVTALGGVAQ